MSPKFLIWLGMLAGSMLGGFLPVLWGASPFSFSSVILTFAGGVLGIWFGYKISNG